MSSVLNVLWIAYGLFCLWMTCACIYFEDDRDERLSWAIALLLFGPLTAPIYYFKNHRRGALQRKRKRMEREAELASLVGKR